MKLNYLSRMGIESQGRLELKCRRLFVIAKFVLRSMAEVGIMLKVSRLIS